MRFSMLLFAAFLLTGTTGLAMAQDDRDQPRRAGTMIVLRNKEKQSRDVSADPKFGLTRNDFRGISEMLAKRATIVPVRTFAGDARRGEKFRDASITGTTADFEIASRLRIVEGRFLSRADEIDRRNVAVLDSKTAAALFPDERPIGQAFRIDQQAFVVVGVSTDHDIYIPVTTMHSRFGDVVIGRASGTFEILNYELSEIRVAVNDPMQSETVLNVVKNLLDHLHESKDYSVEITR